MPKYVLTRAPGAGKTAVLRLLKVDGHVVVEEAATDVIALADAQGQDQPWRDHSFLDTIVSLQQRRQHAVRPADIVFFDRSPVCTPALARHLGFAPPTRLTEEVERVVAEGTYQRTVFLIRNQGFVRPTAARRISFEDSLAFERSHEQTYRELGFHLIEVPRVAGRPRRADRTDRDCPGT
jgi:predicted ATPase